MAFAASIGSMGDESRGFLQSNHALRMVSLNDAARETRLIHGCSAINPRSGENSVPLSTGEFVLDTFIHHVATARCHHGGGSHPGPGTCSSEIHPSRFISGSLLSKVSLAL